MNPTLHLCLALLLPWVAAHALAQQAVSLQRADQTTIAAMAYAPKAGACRGVAVVSPGAGGSETGYSYLGEALGGGSWQTRTEPYRDMPPGCKWLAVIDGATHMNLAGNGMARKTEALTTQVIGDFLDGVQRGNCRAPRAHPGMAIESK